jgi:ATP-dependent DNA ligase
VRFLPDGKENAMKGSTRQGVTREPGVTPALTLAIEPMEARLVESLPQELGWQFEPKWDGFRCLAFRTGREVELHAKSGKPLGRYFPEIVEVVGSLPGERFVLDGELAIPVGDSLSFDALQMRLHPAESRIRKLAGETPAILILFDILVARRATCSSPHRFASAEPRWSGSTRRQ